MSKCKLLSLNEVALLFRGCLFVQKNRIRDIIDRSEKIDYLILLDDILLRSNRPKHTTESTHENASELSRQLDKADQIIGVLAE
jgi:low affinity Fe/Cu permease